MTWCPHLLGNLGVGGQKVCKDSANTTPFPMSNFLGDGLADIKVMEVI